MERKGEEKGRERTNKEARNWISLPRSLSPLKWGKGEAFSDLSEWLSRSRGEGEEGKKDGYLSSLFLPSSPPKICSESRREYLSLPLRPLLESKKVNGSFCSRKPHKVNTRDFKLPHTRCTYNRRVQKYALPKTTLKAIDDNFKRGILREISLFAAAFRELYLLVVYVHGTLKLRMGRILPRTTVPLERVGAVKKESGH